MTTYTRADLDREARYAIRQLRKINPGRGRVQLEGWDLLVEHGTDPVLRVNYRFQENEYHKPGSWHVAI